VYGSGGPRLGGGSRVHGGPRAAAAERLAGAWARGCSGEWKLTGGGGK
jgi:ketosteroid isomerase-like protein